MNPISISNPTRTLNKPTHWDEAKHGPCIGLPIIDSEGVMYSYWSVTWRERLHILLGKPLRLAVVGTSHPPVGIETKEKGK